MSAPSDSNPPTPPDQEPPPHRPEIDPVGVLSPPLPPPRSGWSGYVPGGPPSKRTGIIGRVVTGLVSSLLLISIAMNIYLGTWFAAAMAGPSESTYTQGDKDKRVVILPISGMIDKSVASFVRHALEALREDKPRAVVLRVDSGGGSVAASDRIWHELVMFKEQAGIPIVASFGAVAASGGYYISAPADFIVAEPTTITGSIGVIAQAFTLERLLNKIGVKPELIVATGADKKDMLNPMRAWTDDDRHALRSILDQAHRRFIDIVAQGRANLNAEGVKRLATGEVYTSGQAQQNMLIDQQGYLDTAIAKAKELAGISPTEHPLVTIMSPSRSLSVWRALGTSAMPHPPAVTSGQVRQWIGELSTPHIEYRWVR